MKVLVFPALLAIAIITKPPKPPVTTPATATSVQAVALTTNSPKSRQNISVNLAKATAPNELQPVNH